MILKNRQSGTASRSIASVILDDCNELAIALFPCGGFSSLSFVHEAATQHNASADTRPLQVFYIGDYDAAGVLIDVSLQRELREHLRADIELRFDRIGINADQIEEYDLPTKPRKESDRRSLHIDCAVEAESMPAKILRGLLRDRVESMLPANALAVAKIAERSERQHLRSMAELMRGEAAPHCHIIMLPLFDGRMRGSPLMGNKARLMAIQADFYAKVGQTYGLKRGTPAKRYSSSARATAADKVVSTLRRSPNRLDDPAIRDALRDAIAETMPVNLMGLLGLDLPEVKAPKPKTFVGIMTKQFKPEKPIGFQSRNPIGFAATISAPKDQTLSCVGFADSTPLVPSVDTSHSSDYQEKYIQERDAAMSLWWCGIHGA